MREEMRAKNQFVCVAKNVNEQLRSTFWPEKQKFYAFSSAQKYFKKLVYWPQMKCILHCFSPKSTFGCKSAFQLGKRTGPRSCQIVHFPTKNLT
ncbi:hypothetical protein ES332_D06G093600v1 [Gossypium tomentosum]|uniref:Uncharacterized protein n=1 Tax=Gossypium tomentosum TaxID=34277 RepID=A0A5D2KFP6_GOSTO|nr:hypothetical protein ES332_D06G093600v1 [Gossypium tomentosum]TYH66000.1 hypothetical protein ES332_D06G093600v1 [Gossypium tomentosum]TYH66001.1 hypothetical protein ES332_D06G093600v1 [Gossypium tomentosum]